MSAPQVDDAAVERLETALERAKSDKDAWHQKHQGPLDEIVGYVWWCGDEVCDCTRAEIVARFVNTTDRRWRVPRTLWAGNFYTDGEAGAEDDLRLKRLAVEDSEPELAAKIEWIAAEPRADEAETAAPQGERP